MTWLVTGGAGYIGAHVVRAFEDRGARRRSSSTTCRAGTASSCPTTSRSSRAASSTPTLLAATLREHDVEGVVHVAGFKYAGVSVERPLHTYDQNVTGTVSVLRGDGATRAWTRWCSPPAPPPSAPPTWTPSPRRPPTRPESPYGETKLIGEWLLRDQGTATGPAAHVAALLQRRRLGHRRGLRHQPAQPVPDRLRGARSRAATPRINGDDYATPDGTCVRDYVHVADLAVSHVAAAERSPTGAPLEPVYNLGSGDGLSVREIMDGDGRAVTGIDFTPEIHPRRPGDPAADRRVRRARRPRPRLEDAPHRRRDGVPAPGTHRKAATA